MRHYRGRYAAKAYRDIYSAMGMAWLQTDLNGNFLLFQVKNQIRIFMSESGFLIKYV